MTTYWNGIKSDDFYNTDNWGGGVPQANTSQEANISGTQNAPAIAVANAAAPGQIHSLTIGDYGTLKITATSSQDAFKDVFRAYSMQIFDKGTLIVDTPDAVELGAFDHISGTLTIMNNPGNVVLDSNRLSGAGSLNLINSTLGSSANPVNIDNQMSVTLQGGSTLYAGFYASGASVTVDPSSVNTIVLEGVENNIGTRFNGVSENTRFAFNSADGENPTAARYTPNSDGSYTLNVTMGNGHTLKLDNVHFAEGYVPGTPVIGKDANGNPYIADPNANAAGGNYANDPAHTQLQAIAGQSNAAGGDTSQYSTAVYSQPTVKDHTSFIGQSTTNPHEWNDSANWTDGANPTSNNAQEVSIIGQANSPANVVVDQATFNQISSLSIGDYGSLTITAPTMGNTTATVFATQGFELRGTHSALTIDTAAPVSLGTVNEIEGTLTIRNNPGNVVLDSTRLNGSGTLVLDNSTLGNTGAPIRDNLGRSVLKNGSTLYAGFYAVGKEIDFDDSSNTVIFTGRESVIDTIFTNVGPNTHFGINKELGAEPVAGTWTPNGDGSYTITMTYENGKTLSLPHVYTAPGFHPGLTHFVRNTQSHWIVNTTNQDSCFLSGTMIETRNGPKVVEEIVPGDMMVLHGQPEAFVPVVWVGHQDVTVKTWLAEEDAGYPVRILAGALGKGVPSRDLLVTAEHCLLLDEAFVPVRMLVNGGNIFYDHSITQYRYHHVETERHSVLVAENTPTESYLDTGNRYSFVSSMQIGKAKSWENDAAAPLNTSLAHVQPLYEAIVARAVDAGLPLQSVVTVQDPELTITASDGRTLSIQRQVGSQYVVRIPQGVERITIRSRSSAPSRAIGPFYDDRRELGVLVGAVTLWEADDTHAVESHLRDALAVGWHEVEAGDMRWTNGRGALTLNRRSLDTDAVLTIQILAAGPYILEDAVGFASVV